MIETTKKTVIGVIGTIASGKDVVVEYISQKLGVPAFEISQPLKNIAAERGLALTRPNLIELGTKIAVEKGPEFLARMIVENSGDDRIVINGMRQLAQIEYLREHTKLILIAIEADSETRFQRTVVRGKSGEAETVEEFVKREKDENSGEHIQRLFECLELADYTVTNNDALEDLFKKIDGVIAKENLEHLSEQKNEFKQRPR